MQVQCIASLETTLEYISEHIQMKVQKLQYSRDAVTSLTQIVSLFAKRRYLDYDHT